MSCLNTGDHLLTKTMQTLRQPIHQHSRHNFIFNMNSTFTFGSIKGKATFGQNFKAGLRWNDNLQKMFWRAVRLKWFVNGKIIRLYLFPRICLFSGLPCCTADISWGKVKEKAHQAILVLFFCRSHRPCLFWIILFI